MAARQAAGEEGIGRGSVGLDGVVQWLRMLDSRLVINTAEKPEEKEREEEKGLEETETKRNCGRASIDGKRESRTGVEHGWADDTS